MATWEQMMSRNFNPVYSEDLERYRQRLADSRARNAQAMAAARGRVPAQAGAPPFSPFAPPTIRGTADDWLQTQTQMAQEVFNHQGFGAAEEAVTNPPPSAPGGSLSGSTSGDSGGLFTGQQGGGSPPLIEGSTSNDLLPMLNPGMAWLLGPAATAWNQNAMIHNQALEEELGLTPTQMASDKSELNNMIESGVLPSQDGQTVDQEALDRMVQDMTMVDAEQLLNDIKPPPAPPSWESDTRSGDSGSSSSDAPGGGPGRGGESEPGRDRY